MSETQKCPTCGCDGTIEGRAKSALKVRCGELEAALKPFVDAMPPYVAAPIGPDDDWFVRQESIDGLTVGSVRKARAVLEQQTDLQGRING